MGRAGTSVELVLPLGAVVSVDDVELDRDLDVVELRREMERAGAPAATAKAA